MIPVGSQVIMMHEEDIDYLESDYFYLYPTRNDALNMYITDDAIYSQAGEMGLVIESDLTFIRILLSECLWWSRGSYWQVIS